MEEAFVLHRAIELPSPPRKLEKMRFLDERHPVYYPDAYPVIVSGAGMARWIGDVEWHQKLQAMFAVEQVTHGNAIFFQNGREYLVKPGEVYLLQVGGENAYRTGPAGVVNKRFVAFYGPAVLSLLRTMELIGRDVIRPAKPHVIGTAMKGIYSLLEKKEADWPARLSVAAYELLLLLSKSDAQVYPPPLAAVLQFIEHTIESRVTLRSLCERANLSATNLSRLFKRCIGQAPMKYLASRRMALAQQLLAESSMSIKEVAAAVGYDNQLHFSARFKKNAGCSPRAFRGQQHAGR